MINPLLRRTLLCASLAFLPTLAAAAPAIGQAAPDFSAVDSKGKPVKLSDFAGKPVVLEWTNEGCPYVRKWYGSGEMQKLQRDAAGMGAVWLTVVSSAPGEQGYVDGAGADAMVSKAKAAPAHVLLDPEGRIGRSYGAQTTPHMYVIAADGKLAYMGGIDSIASTRIEDIPKAEPYAREALQAVVAGQAVSKPVTRAYGCSVKYKG
ncbi:redoxin domain-containing protein [Niveibacterium sp. SC-1]|uniref:redoxin domain-containing protein n=1 Tax=Niveibacterium sp. SC-1 TaxID=3135646 RepID=UPI00311E88F7